ncbi:MAG: hypothetical protein H7263_15345, partial [Candidatus Sericytochromatia bacterium]|nr:hypothetical protein [Candidatus Sericytochromatia bacterium]
PSKKSGIDISTDLQSFKSDDSKNILVLNEKFTLLKNYLKENSLSIDFNTGKVLVSDQKFSPLSIQENQSKNIDHTNSEDINPILFNSKTNYLKENSVAEINNPATILNLSNENISLAQPSKQINNKLLDEKIITNNFVKKDIPLNNLKLKTNTLDIVEKSVLNDSNSTNIIDHSPLATRKFSSESDGQINNYFPLYKQSFPSKQNENIIVSPKLGIKVTPNIVQANNKVDYSNINKDSILVSTDVASKQNENIILSSELGIKVTPNIIQTNNKVGYSNINKDSILVSTDVDSKQNENIIVSSELGIKVTPNIIQANNKVDYSNINKEEKVFIFNETLRALNSYLKSNNIEINSLNSPQIDDYKEPKLSLNTKTNIIENNLNISSDSINMNNLENEDNSINYLAPKTENEDNHNLSDTNLNPDNLVDINPLITKYISIINESILNKENKKTEEPKALPDLINNTIGQIDYVLVNVRDNKINKEPIELENIFKSNYKYNDVEQDIKIMPQNAFIFSSIISPLINNDKNVPKTINKDNYENKKLYNIFKEFINSEFPEVEIIEDSIEKKYFSNDLKFVKNELFSSKNEKLEKFINNISENSSGELIEKKDDDNVEIKNTNPFLSSSQIIKAINNGVAIHFSQITEVVQELASNPAKIDKNIVMNITLKPQNLGEISLTCTLTEGNKMSVIFETSTSAAQKVIESYVKNIKDIIKDNSLIVHEVSSSYSSAPSSSKPISSREKGSSNNGTNNSSSESTKNYNQRRKRRRDDNDNDSSDSSLSI